MTLRERIAELPDGEEIAVGCTSAWHYIGTAAHFREAEGRVSTTLLEALINRKNNMVKALGNRDRDGAWREKAKRLIDGMAQSIEQFKPLAAREIRREYITEIYGRRAFLVEGREAGAFWFREEYENWERTGKTSLPAPKGIGDESDN